MPSSKWLTTTLLATMVAMLFCPPSSGQAFIMSLFWPKPHLRDYDLLNNNLVDHVRNDDAVANIREALKWLKMATKEEPADPNIKLPSPVALMEFTNLVKLMDPRIPHCNMTAYSILKVNEYYTGSRVLVSNDKLGAVRRIETVIHNVAVRHANMCRYNYPPQMEQALDKAHRETVRDIHNLMGAIISVSDRIVIPSKGRPSDWRNLRTSKAKGISMKGQNEATAVLCYLRERSREDTDNHLLHVKNDLRRRNTWVVHEGEVVKLLKRYVYSRCQYLDNTFGSVLKPVELDQELYRADNKYRPINDEVSNLMLWLQYSRICSDMMANKVKLEKNVIKAIRSPDCE